MARRRVRRRKSGLFGSGMKGTLTKVALGAVAGVVIGSIAQKTLGGTIGGLAGILPVYVAWTVGGGAGALGYVMATGGLALGGILGNGATVANGNGGVDLA